MDKIQISLTDPKTRAIWTAIQRAKAEVARWPASKRGEDLGLIAEVSALATLDACYANPRDPL